MNNEKKYDSKEFIQKLRERTGGMRLPCCPYCKETDYTTPPEMATILITNSFSGLQLGPTIPCAMVICKKCGHIDYFAIGALGMLPNPDTNKEEAKDVK